MKINFWLRDLHEPVNHGVLPSHDAEQTGKMTRTTVNEMTVNVAIKGCTESKHL